MNASRSHWFWYSKTVRYARRATFGVLPTLRAEIAAIIVSETIIGLEICFWPSSSGTRARRSITVMPPAAGTV